MIRRLIQDFFFPTPYSIYHGVEINRCKTDGQIVTKNMDLSKHAGHQVSSPVNLSLKEKVLVWLTIIR